MGRLGTVCRFIGCVPSAPTRRFIGGLLRLRRHATAYLRHDGPFLRDGGLLREVRGNPTLLRHFRTIPNTRKFTLWFFVFQFARAVSKEK